MQALMVCTVGPASTGWRHCACLYIYFVPFWNYRDRSGFERAAALLAELRAAGPPGPGAGLVLLEGHFAGLPQQVSEAEVQVAADEHGARCRRISFPGTWNRSRRESEAGVRGMDEDKG